MLLLLLLLMMMMMMMIPLRTRPALLTSASVRLLIST